MTTGQSILLIIYIILTVFPVICFISDKDNTDAFVLEFVFILIVSLVPVLNLFLCSFCIKELVHDRKFRKCFFDFCRPYVINLIYFLPVLLLLILFFI